MYGYFVLSLLSSLSPDVGGTASPPALPFYATPPAAFAPNAVPTAHAKLPAPPAPASRAWMLSAEAATRAPVDTGAQLTLESPYHLRLSVGYGWVPSSYSNLFTGIASSASGNAEVGAILSHASYRGRTFRTALGVRPFNKAGLHLDVGYARVNLDGTLDLAESGVAVLQSLGGVYAAHSTMDAWLVEVGSQVEAWGVVFGFAFGLMHTFAAHTSISGGSGLPASVVLAEAAQQADAALKSYGYVPTLTLRLGFDLLSVRSWPSSSSESSEPRPSI